jgi:hypothetical protein
MYLIYLQENRMLKLLKLFQEERRGMRENDGGGEPNQGTLQVFMKCPNEIPCTTTIKMSLKDPSPCSENFSYALSSLL